MLFCSGKYLRHNDCDHLFSLGGYYLGTFRPFSTVIQNLLPFAPDILSLYRYSFPKHQSHGSTSNRNIFSLISNFIINQKILYHTPQPIVSKNQYFFPLTYIKFLLLRRFTLYSAAKSENVFYFTDKSKEALNRYGIYPTRFHQFENSAIWNPAESTQNSRNTTNDCKVHTHDTLETSKCFTESFNSSTERSNSFIKPSPYTYHYRSDSIESEHIQGQFVSHSVNYFSKIPLSKNEAGESGSDHFNNTFEKEILEKISHSGSDAPNDTTKQNSISAATPQRPDYLNLLYVAELLPYKNHLPLLDTVNDLLIEGYNISLTLVGDLHNFYSRKIIEFRNSLGFAGEITFLGSLPHEELLKTYPIYDCLVYPSLVESLGIPIYEAIAFRLPIICSNYIDFIPYTDTSSISLFNPLSKDELKNCIRELYFQKFPKSYEETNSSDIFPIESTPIESSHIELTEKF